MRWYEHLFGIAAMLYPLFLLFVWSLCKAASDADDYIERLRREVDG